MLQACADLTVLTRWCDYPLTCHRNLPLNPRALSSRGRDMSSPERPHFSQADFLARWMPSSSRAGVILSPCPDLTGTLRHTSAALSDVAAPEDSFASDFAPLPGSVDSSCCLGADGGARLPGGERAAVDRPVNAQQPFETLTNTDGGLEAVDAMGSISQQVSPMMKLEQVRMK